MKKISILILLLVATTSIQAQKKTELLAEIASLKDEIGNTKAALTTSKKEARVNATRVESIESELVDLRAANKQLLENIKTFTTASSQKSDNINNTLKTLQKKEKQLQAISDAYATQDSITLLTFTSLKKTLGEDAKIAASNNAIYVTIDNAKLFGDVDTQYTVTPEAETLLNKLATVINTNASLTVGIETTSNALTFANGIVDNWDLSARQAAAIASLFQNKFAVDPARLIPFGKSDVGFDGVETSTQIKLSPKYDSFYAKLKEDMKNSD